ncbi:MAG: YggS family pyridoxal phosphate-dependent enzyme [Planctomycetota bacterium]
MHRDLETNLRRVRARIATAAGRSARPVTLVAVTKSVPASMAAALVRLGQTELAENRADALESKRRALAALGLAPRWHFLGHVQTNKARHVVEHADVIQSVDSVRLLDAIERHATALGRTVDVFLQLKIAPGAARTGLDESELCELVSRARTARAVRLRGLMTLGPAPDPERPDESRAASRAVFEAVAACARALAADRELASAFEGGRVLTSMGMSDDFELAIEAGSDLVRIGGALFESGEEAA